MHLAIHLLGHTDDPDSARQAGRLKWGLELADGLKATNIDASPYAEQPNQDHHRPQHSDDCKPPGAQPIW